MQWLSLKTFIQNSTNLAYWAGRYLKSISLKFCNSVFELAFSLLKFYAVETLHSLINFHHESMFQVLPLTILMHSVMQEIFSQIEVIDQEAVLLELFHTYWFCGSIFCCFYLFPTQLLTYRLSAVSCRLSWHRIIKFVNEYLCKESFLLYRSGLF